MLLVGWVFILDANCTPSFHNTVAFEACQFDRLCRKHFSPGTPVLRRSDSRRANMAILRTSLCCGVESFVIKHSTLRNKTGECNPALKLKEGGAAAWLGRRGPRDSSAESRVLIAGSQTPRRRRCLSPWRRRSSHRRSPVRRLRHRLGLRTSRTLPKSQVGPVLVGSCGWSRVSLMWMPHHTDKTFLGGSG